MKKIVIAVVIILAILAIFITIEKHRRHETYNTVHYSQSYHRESLGDTFVRSAVRGAGSYAGYHVAKSILGGHKRHSHRYA